MLEPHAIDNVLIIIKKTTAAIGERARVTRIEIGISKQRDFDTVKVPSATTHMAG